MGIRKEVWRVPDLLGFSAHWAWIWCVFWSNLFYSDHHMITGSSLNAMTLETLWVLSLSANVVTIAVLLVASYFKNPFSRIRYLPVAAAACTAIGTVAIVPAFFPATGPLWEAGFVAGSFLTGIGSGIIVVLWGELFASLGAKRTISYSVISLFIACALYFILMILPPSFSPALVALLPVVSMACFLHFKNSLAQIPRKKANARVSKKPPMRLIAVSLLFGVSFGVMKGFLSPFGTEIIMVRDLLNILAIICATIAIFATMSIFKMDFDHLTYRIALPLMAAGFLFLPFHGWMSAVGTAIHQLGYQYFFLILWALWPILAVRSETPPGWIVCWSLLSIQAGQLAGSLASTLFLNSFDSPFALAMTSAFCIFLILCTALLLSGNTSAKTGWGFIKPIEEADAATQFEKTCTYLARQYRLSPREIEVFFLLAKGRNRAHISDELVIADETAKSHIKNVYRKVQVHSQQELIDRIEEVSSAS